MDLSRPDYLPSPTERRRVPGRMPAATRHRHAAQTDTWHRHAAQTRGRKGLLVSFSVRPQDTFVVPSLSWQRFGVDPSLSWQTVGARFVQGNGSRRRSSRSQTRQSRLTKLLGSRFVQRNGSGGSGSAEERGKRKEERGKRKEERGKRKEGVLVSHRT
jgi:hypothetical protein